jgi:hypothetical protein
MPYVVHFRRAGEVGPDADAFQIPFLLRRRAEREAARAGAARGLGVVVTPTLRWPFYFGPVESWVCRIGWREWRRLTVPPWST